MQALALRRLMSSSSSRAARSSFAPHIRHETEGSLVFGHPVTPLAMNQYVIACLRKKQAAIIDSGSVDPAPFIDYCEAHGYTITHLLQTHAHVDHIAGLADTKRALPGARVYMHEKEMQNHGTVVIQGGMFGVDCSEPPTPDVWLNDKDIIDVGDLRIKVLFAPGHTAGHVCFLEENEKVLFSGDALFKGSVGRTDLPGGSAAVLKQSLQRLVAEVADDAHVFPGHMSPTTMGHEKKTNMFLRSLPKPKL